MALKRKTDLTAVRSANMELHRAMKMAARARRKLARATRPGAPYVVMAPECAWVHQMLERRAKVLLQNEGVVGYGIGRAVKNGVLTNEQAVTVFVRTKATPGELAKQHRKALPKTMSAGGKRIRVDVIEIGDLERLAFAGESVGPTNDPHEPEGTIGVFARDFDNGNTVAITAMHVSGLREFPDGMTSAPEFVVPSVVRQDPATQRLGVLGFGTTSGVDAAKITLDDPADASNTIPEIGPVQSWRSIASPADDGISVFMFGARSGKQQGHVIQAFAVFPDLGLNPALIVDITARQGDSGAALVDEGHHVIGFLVGRPNNGPFAGKIVFSAASAVVDALNCDF